MRKGIGLHTVLFLVIGYVGMALSGSVQASYFPNPLFELTIRLILALNLGLWAVRDARRIGRPIPLLAEQWFVIFGWVLVPAYAIRSRGWRGLGWTIFHGIGWYALLYLTFAVTAAIAWG